MYISFFKYSASRFDDRQQRTFLLRLPLTGRKIACLHTNTSSLRARKQTNEVFFFFYSNPLVRIVSPRRRLHTRTEHQNQSITKLLHSLSLSPPSLTHTCSGSPSPPGTASVRDKSISSHSSTWSLICPSSR